MNKEDNELEIETYKVDGEPRVALTANIGPGSTTLIVEGEAYLKWLRDNINSILDESQEEKIEVPKWPEGPEIVPEGAVG